MANKITCPNCGHSWDKSTSTSKDAHVCHICGKANVNMKDGGWLNKYADDGGEYLGTTNRGFNYNGAWGGTMAMGGSLPGAVGFTYARTQGSAPANGKYTKKTKASAQDGRAVSDNTKTKPVIVDKPMNRETVRPAVSSTSEDERTLLGALSNFIPYYETYVDLKDTFVGGLTGDKSRLNQGIIGLGAPFAGKALTSSIDYATEKALGKDVADYNETKRNSIVNMSQSDRQKLFEKYGPGGYDKWIKSGKPKLQNGGEMKFYQEGLDWKPRNISKDGSETPQPKKGWKERLAEETAKLDNPLSALQLTKKGYSKDDIKTIQKAASKEQPVIQSPKGKQLTREQILQKNKEYAEAQGKRFDPNSGAVTPFLSQSVGKAFDRANESVLNTANAALNVPAKLVQSAYKPGYTAEDALIGKPSGSSIGEDIVTDPGMIASLGGKGLLKGLLKGALGKGALGKGMLSSALLPFYASREKSPAAMSAFMSKLDEVKELITKPEAKSAFRKVGDVITRRPDIAALDQNYSNAIVDANLPVNAIDRYAKSLISIDPAENALSSEQVKYLNNVTGLQTNVGLLDPIAIPFRDKMQFIIDNSKRISPRDILPFFYENSYVSKSEKDEFLKKLYDSYSGQNVANPLAEYTAATDLVSLADTYNNRFSSLSDDIKLKMRELTKLGDQARPSVYIDAPYYKDEFYNDRSREAVKMMARRYNPATYQVERYTSIPKIEELTRESIKQGKKTIESVNEIFNNPANKGNFYTASHNLSTDSHPLGLQLLSRNKDLLDFVPVHEGAPHHIATQSNTLGGLSNYSSNRRTYLNQLKPKFDKNLGNIDNAVGSTAATKQLQEQMIESGLLNYHINEFNKKVGTNMPSAYYSGFYNELQRPNIGAIIKKQGGVVKDNMGYWNPDNWGKSVEIDSNDITMQGVYQPLIGVSDVGDVQYMEPGQDYKFKGKKVTEYPVKKKSGGWLDKYK